jgi:hypothetical protein
VVGKRASLPEALPAEGSWRPNLRFEPTGLPSVGLQLKRGPFGGWLKQRRRYDEE